MDFSEGFKADLAGVFAAWGAMMRLVIFPALKMRRRAKPNQEQGDPYLPKPLRPVVASVISFFGAVVVAPLIHEPPIECLMTMFSGQFGAMVAFSTQKAVQK